MHRTAVARSSRAAIVGLALLVVAGCAGVTNESRPGDTSAPTGTAAPQAQLAALDTVLGQAYLDAPVAGATVRLLDRAGNPVASDGAYDTTTNEDGVFTVHPPRLPADFTIEVSGGREGNEVFTGVLRREVAQFNGWEDLGANAFTTLVAAYHRAHGDLSLADSEAQVRLYLGLSAEHRTEGLEVGTTDTFFSEKAFQEADAADPGDFDAFVARVSQDIVPGATRSFAGPPPNQLAAAAAAVTVVLYAAKIVAIGNCVANAERRNLDSFAGCVLNNATDPALEGALDAINGQLRDLNNSMNDLGQLQGRTIAQIGQNNWSNLMLGLEQRYFQPIRNVQDRLVCATNRSLKRSTRQECQEVATAALQGINNNGLAEALSNELSGSAANRVPTLRFVSDYARQAAGRFFRAPSQVSTGNDLSGAIQNAWQYIDANQAVMSWLLIEYQNTRPRPDQAFINQSIVFPYLGNPAVDPTADPPALVPTSQRTSDCPTANVTVLNCRGSRERALRLIPRPLPPGTTIDTATGQMWLQNIGSRDGETTSPPAIARTLSGYNRDAGTASPFPQQNEPDCGGRVWRATAGANCPSVWRVSNMAASVNAGFTDWRTPTQEQLERLVRSGVDGPPTGTTLPQWLSQSGGFYWIFGPYGNNTDREQRPVSTIGDRICHDVRFTSPFVDPLSPTLNTLPPNPVCTRPEPRAYTMTSNGQRMICDTPEWPRGCINGDQQVAVNLLTGQTTFGEVYRWDDVGLWAMATRPLAPCEFYFDDVSGPAPADRDRC